MSSRRFLKLLSNFSWDTLRLPWHNFKPTLPTVFPRSQEHCRVVVQAQSLHPLTEYQFILSALSQKPSCVPCCRFMFEVLKSKLCLDQNSSSAFWQRDCLSRVRRAITSDTGSSPWTLLSLVRTLTLLVIFSFSPTTAKTQDNNNFTRAKFHHTLPLCVLNLSAVGG